MRLRFEELRTLVAEAVVQCFEAPVATTVRPGKKLLPTS